MCFVLYAGTANPLPRSEWSKDSRSINVQSLTDRDASVKTHFSSPEVQYIGSTSGCGCDFPHAMFQNGGWPEIDSGLEGDPDQTARDEQNLRALVDLIRDSGETTVELYGIWDGDFSAMPEAREEIALKDINVFFCFKERGFYIVAVRNQTIKR